MKVDRLKNLKEKILWVLSQDEHTRNDDAYLTMQIIIAYLPDEYMTQGGRYFFTNIALRAVREDAVKRIRAQIQNEYGLYLPTDPAVRRKRKISEEKWRIFLGYNPEMRTV